MASGTTDLSRVRAAAAELERLFGTAVGTGGVGFTDQLGRPDLVDELVDTEDEETWDQQKMHDGDKDAACRYSP